MVLVETILDTLRAISQPLAEQQKSFLDTMEALIMETPICLLEIFKQVILESIDLRIGLAEVMVGF